METTKQGNNIVLSLTNDEALVLLDWLIRFNEEENSSVFDDQSEERVLFDLEAVLEKSIVEIFDGNYRKTLANARENVRDSD